MKGPLHSQLPDIVDLTGTSSEEDDHVQSSVKRKRCDVTKACPNCFIDVAIGAGISSSCAKVSCPACGALFCGLCAKKASRTRCDCQKKEEGDFSKLLKPPVLGTRGTESTWLTNFQIQDIIGELVKEERHKEAGWLQMLALPRTGAAWRKLYTSNKLHIFCDTCHAHHSVLILGPSAVQGRWFMYLDSLRADLRADLHILLDNHDFTEVFLRNLPRQRNSVCGFWVCEMVEQVMQAVRNPLAMPAPLRFGNCWPPEEHLVNKWRGFMARPHPQLDEGGDGGGAAPQRD